MNTRRSLCQPEKCGTSDALEQLKNGGTNMNFHYLLEGNGEIFQMLGMTFTAVETTRKIGSCARSFANSGWYGLFAVI